MPKYQIGDEVWVIVWNKAEKAKVVGIFVDIEKTPSRLSYHVGTVSSKKTKVEGPYLESDLFPTKEKLLASL